MLLYMNVSGQDVIVSGTNLSANVSSNAYNLPHVKHAQKTVNYTYNNGNYDEYRSISLTRQQVNARTERSSIVLSNENITNHNTPDRIFNDGTRFQYITFNDSVRIYDIALGRDKLYMCGFVLQTPVVNESTVEASIYDTVGFIAEASLNNLFAGVNSISFVKAFHSFRKIMVNEENGEEILYLMGTDRTPAMRVMEHFNFLDPSQSTWRIEPAHKNDLLFIYNSNGTSKLIKTLKKIEEESFQDFDISNNRLNLMSLKFDDNSVQTRIYTPNSIELSRKLYTRSFTLPILTQSTGYFDIVWYDHNHIPFDEGNMKGIYNVHLNRLDNTSNRYFLSFNHYESDNGYSCIVNDIEWSFYSNANIFTGYNSYRVFDFTDNEHRIISAKPHYATNYGPIDTKILVIASNPDNPLFDDILFLPALFLPSDHNSNFFSYASHQDLCFFDIFRPDPYIFFGSTFCNELHISNIDYLNNKVFNNSIDYPLFRTIGSFGSNLRNHMLPFFQFTPYKYYHNNSYSVDCMDLYNNECYTKPYPIDYCVDAPEDNINVQNYSPNNVNYTIGRRIVSKSIGNCDSNILKY